MDNDAGGKSALSDGLGPLPEWALQVAAQCWCDPTTSMIEMDHRLAAVFAARLAAERERCARICETAAETALGATSGVREQVCAALIRRA